MGSSISRPTMQSLTPEDIEAIQNKVADCPYHEADIKRLYERFVRLDRSGSGTLSRSELLNVPEFAMNPLAARIIDHLFGAAGHTTELSFTDFLSFLSIFHPDADPARKARLAFAILTGQSASSAPSPGSLRPLSRDDLCQLIALMAGTGNLTPEQVDALIQVDLSAAVNQDTLCFEDFARIFHSQLQSRMSLKS